jgi:hypothetical protein
VLPTAGQFHLQRHHHQLFLLQLLSTGHLDQDSAAKVRKKYCIMAVETFC